MVVICSNSTWEKKVLFTGLEYSNKWKSEISYKTVLELILYKRKGENESLYRALKLMPFSKFVTYKLLPYFSQSFLKEIFS